MENQQENSNQAAPAILIPGRDDKTEKCDSGYEKIIEGTYRKDEAIHFFSAGTNIQEQIRQKIKYYTQYGYDPNMIEVVTCDNCDIPVALFRARNIHTLINTEPVKAGSVVVTDTVGESLNFYNRIPFDYMRSKEARYAQEQTNKKKDDIVVAVLDTGFDSNMVNPQYLWQGDDNGSSCYKGVKTGWNFIKNDANVFDDNLEQKHGSTVSQYIINQFKRSPANNVRIMPLKTHDKDGVGDLFSIICAINFAIAKKVNIINASWGFYYYFNTPIPYLDELITKTLPRAGILFITASGNQVKEEDLRARQIYYKRYQKILTDDQLRDLFFHRFYPAQLSAVPEKNSVITVATNNDKKVSETQNHSVTYADLGVHLDAMHPDNMHMLFQSPFAGASEYKSGSSYATAIASGIIGAFTDKSMFATNLDKNQLLGMLSGKDFPGTTEKIIRSDENLKIRKGYFTKRLS